MLTALNVLSYEQRLQLTRSGAFVDNFEQLQQSILQINLVFLFLNLKRLWTKTCSDLAKSYHRNVREFCSAINFVIFTEQSFPWTTTLWVKMNFTLKDLSGKYEHS